MGYNDKVKKGMQAAHDPPVEHNSMGTMGHETDSAALQRVLQQVAHFYEAEVDWETHIERRFVEGFLQALADQGADAETYEAAWETIRFLVWYLDHLGPEISSLETLRAYHFSELVTDFTDRKVLGRIGMTERLAMATTVRDFFAYLTAAGGLSQAQGAMLAQAYQTMSATPGQITRIERPEPLGGETFSATVNRGQEIIYTYNDYWLTLVCLRDFGGHWETMKAAVHALPDAAAKLRLMERLLSLEQQRVEGLRNLLGLRQPAPAELQRARRFVRTGHVNLARAW